VGSLRSLRRAAGQEWLDRDRGAVESLRMPRSAETGPDARAAILASDVVQFAIGLLKPGIREFEVAAESNYQ